MSARIWGIGLAVVSVAAAASCSATPTSPASPPLAPPPVNAANVCLTFGPEGGSLTHPGGAQLVVPPGALAAPTSLCLAGVEAPASAVLGGGPALAQAYDASPAGQTFHKPVDLILPFDPARIPAGASLDQVQMHMAPQGTNDFVALVSAVDLQNRTVRARTVHFTQFVPAVNPNPVFITSPASLSNATVGIPYAQAFAALGGTAPYVWSLSPQNAAPPGLAIAPSGSLGGTPTLPSTFSFFVVATDNASHAVEEAFDLTVLAPTNPLPTLAQVLPNSVAQGAPTTTVTLTGTGFAPVAQALWDGAAIPTAFVSATSLSAAIPAANLVDAGTHQIRVSNPAPGGGTSAPLSFIVTGITQNPVPSIASVTPPSLPVSAIDVQVTISGASFIAPTSAAIGAQGISTSYVSASELRATIPASYLSAPGTLAIDVYTPPPGGGFSATSINVTVGSLNPVPTLTSLSPSSVVAGTSPFTLNATGTNFVNGGQLFFGSTALSTTVSSATGASASVPAYLVSSPGSALVTFVNPTPGGGATSGLTFSITGADGGSDAGSDASADVATDAPVCVTPPAPAACGDLGGPCCGGTTCNGYTCLNGVCAQAGACGGIGEPCCPAGYCKAGTCSITSNNGNICSGGGASANEPGGTCSVCLAGLPCGAPNAPAGSCVEPGSACDRTGISTGFCTAPTLPAPYCVLRNGCTPATTRNNAFGNGCCDPTALCVAVIGQPYNQCCRQATLPCMVGSDCCSGVCTGGVCVAGATGSACTSDAFCTSNPPPPPNNNQPTCNVCSQKCCAQGTWPGNGC